MTAFLITYPRGQGEDVLVEDPGLTLHVRDGWAVLSDERGPCLAIPTNAGATIQRIDAQPDTPAG